MSDTLDSLYWLRWFYFVGRDETITEHVMYWNKQKVMKLHISLSKRYIEVQYLELSLKTVFYNFIYFWTFPFLFNWQSLD
jgi:hypothetical protein